MNLIIFFVLFLIPASLFFGTFQSFAAQFYIRKKLKRALHRRRIELQQAKPYQSLLFEIHKSIFDDVVNSRNRLFFRNERKFAQQVSQELKGLIKNPFTRLWAKLVVTVKGLSAAVFFMTSLFFGSLVLDEYKLSSLTLPTVNPDITLPVSVDLENELKQLVATVFPTNELPQFELPALSSEDIVPYYPTQEIDADIIAADALGQAIAQNMSHFKSQFSISYVGDIQHFDADLEKAYDWLKINEPYLWAIMSQFNTQAVGDHRSVTLNVTMSYDLTAEENALVYGKIKQITESVPNTSTDLEKAKFVNDYLVSQTKYNANSPVNPHTPYAVLFHGEGVCEGYALAAYLMLQQLGVEAKYVVGDAGGPHAWNLVKINGEWYHLDTTWNDPLPDQGQNIRYDYFLLSDKTLAKDHTWDTAFYPATAQKDYL